MSAALDYTYRYPFPSALTSDKRGANLSLATCSGPEEHPHFFDGVMVEPRVTAEMLLVLSQVVRTHFFLARPPIMDPVLTSNENMLRLEGFSGCCGVYARVDLPAEAFDSEIQGRGTTNVDFNDPMRSALTRVRDQQEVRLSVGRDEVALSRDGSTTVEKKVKLPLRWLKGFSEVQAYQPGLSERFEVPASDGLRFLRSLPTSGAPKRPVHVVPAGRGLRMSSRPVRGAVVLSGTHRVRVLEPLLRRARGLRVWSDDETGTSGWEVLFDRGRFFLMLSPELYRGFSGEGQNLETLARGVGKELVTRVRAQLTWQHQIDPEALAGLLGASGEEVGGALALLGSRGLAGFDRAAGCYFHRELPFDLSLVEKLQPRLQGARKLLEQGGLKIGPRQDDSIEVAVPGTEITHLVRLGPAGDRCTCPWFSKYQGQRGPCKHILAAGMFVEGDGDDPGGA